METFLEPHNCTNKKKRREYQIEHVTIKVTRIRILVTIVF
jgi:hypothetical protein